ncbi:MAG: Hsp20/alpha crystallin family protein [Verrucomicrobia bacterium]|nr:Hsp20/alpha crystallin family protein [Verrucomicrobiota bacterium]
MNAHTRYSPFRSVWDPIQELEDVENRMARFLRRSPLAGFEKETAALTDWSPSVDITEDEKEFLIKVELPEVKKEDVEVSVENGALQIAGERKMEKEEKGKKYHRVERAYGSFSRSFTLPDGADPSKINAEYKEGILNVHIAKGEKSTAKAIEVK